MTDHTNVRPLPPPSQDDVADMAVGVQEHLRFVNEMAKVLAGEYLALRENGVDTIGAALIIGQRYRTT